MIDFLDGGDYGRALDGYIYFVPVIAVCGVVGGRASAVVATAIPIVIAAWRLPPTSWSQLVGFMIFVMGIGLFGYLIGWRTVPINFRTRPADQRDQPAEPVDSDPRRQPPVR